MNAEETRGKVQALVAVALMQKATSVEGGFGYYMRMDGLANLVQTDMDVKAIGAFLESIRSIRPRICRLRLCLRILRSRAVKRIKFLPTMRLRK